MTEPKVAFLGIGCGGFGGCVATLLRALNEEYDSPLRLTTLAINSDTNELSQCRVDASLSIGLTQEQLRGVFDNPVGPVGSYWTKKNPSSVRLIGERGMGSNPVNTQLVLERRQSEIARSVRDGIQHLIRSYDADQVVPILVGSSGGGTGRGLLSWLTDRLATPQFTKLIVRGSRIPLRPPLIFNSAPFYYVNDAQTGTKENAIWANIGGFRWELAAMSSSHKYQMAFHTNLSNGNVLLTKETAAENLAGSIFYTLRFYNTLESRWKDDLEKAVDHSPRLQNTPEHKGLFATPKDQEEWEAIQTEAEATDYGMRHSVTSRPSSNGHPLQPR